MNCNLNEPFPATFSLFSSIQQLMLNKCNLWWLDLSSSVRSHCFATTAALMNWYWKISRPAARHWFGKFYYSTKCHSMRELYLPLEWKVRSGKIFFLSKHYHSAHLWRPKRFQTEYVQAITLVQRWPQLYLEHLVPKCSDN